MKTILKELCDFLTNARLHLSYDDVVMCEVNGIGAIYIKEYELRDEVFNFLNEIDSLNVYIEDCNYAEIRFYSNEYKSEIESVESISEDTHNDWTAEDRRNWFWEIVSSRELNRWIADKYCVDGFVNSYWYQLNPNGHNNVLTQRFITKGSEISKDRRVVMETSIRELEDHELSEGNCVIC